MKTRFSIALTALLLLGLCAGCVPAEVSPTPSTTATRTPAPTVRPAATRTQTTPAQAITSTVFPTITWTPLPTLPPDQVSAYIEELLVNNGGCELPCWWGITPGLTTWSEANHFLASFVEITSFGNHPILKDYLIEYPLETERGVGGFRVSTQGEQIDYIFVGRATTAHYSLMPQLLMNYGVPDNVYIHTFTSFPEDGIPFTIVIYNSKNRFIAVYGLTAYANDEEVIGCINGESPNLFLLSPYEVVTQQRLQDWSLGVDPSTPLMPLEQATNLNPTSFTELITNSSTSDGLCISTNKANWIVKP